MPVAKGDRVGLLYASANFDEDVFEDPFRFDIARDPNPHVAFGGHGAHYCIGANLARLEVKLIFNALADAGVSVSQLGGAAQAPQRLDQRRQGAPGLLQLNPPHPGPAQTARLPKGATVSTTEILPARLRLRPTRTSARPPSRTSSSLALRQNAPVWWVEQEPEARAGFLDTGFFAVSQARRRRRGVQEQQGLLVGRERRDHPVQGGHARATRSSCSGSCCSTRTRRSTPRPAASSAAASRPGRSTRSRDHARQRAERIVEDALAKGEGDFVTEVAAELPAAGDRRPARRTAGGPAPSSSTGPTRCSPRTTRSTAVSRTWRRPRS